jgi:hypothetical protein
MPVGVIVLFLTISDLIKYQYKPSFYYVDEFLCVKMIYLRFLSNICSIVHRKFVYFYIYDLFRILLSL